MTKRSPSKITSFLGEPKDSMEIPCAGIFRRLSRRSTEANELVALVSLERHLRLVTEFPADATISSWKAISTSTPFAKLTALVTVGLELDDPSLLILMYMGCGAAAQSGQSESVCLVTVPLPRFPVRRKIKTESAEPRFYPYTGVAAISPPESGPSRLSSARRTSSAGFPRRIPLQRLMPPSSGRCFASPPRED